MLTEKIKQIKTLLAPYKDDIFIASIIILVAIIGFGFGRLSVVFEQKTPLKVEFGGQTANTANLANNPQNGPNLALKNTQNPNYNTSAPNGKKMYVASKNSDKYHLPECPGARHISENNKIWFSSKEEAEKMGYKPASNCEGL